MMKTAKIMVPNRIPKDAVHQVASDNGQYDVGPRIPSVEIGELVGTDIHGFFDFLLKGSWVIEAEIGAESEEAHENEGDESMAECPGVAEARPGESFQSQVFVVFQGIGDGPLSAAAKKRSVFVTTYSFYISRHFEGGIMSRAALIVFVLLRNNHAFQSSRRRGNEMTRICLHFSLIKVIRLLVTYIIHIEQYYFI